MLPLSTVDKPGFRVMISRFNPRYDMPTRSYFSRIAIPALYREVREELQAELMSADMDHFSGTTDLWSSAMKPYLSYTIHYVTTSWELKSYCLQARYMPEDHTGMNLQDVLMSSVAYSCQDKSGQCLLVCSVNVRRIPFGCSQIIKYCMLHEVSL